MVVGIARIAPGPFLSSLGSGARSLVETAGMNGAPGETFQQMKAPWTSSKARSRSSATMSSRGSTSRD